VFAQHLDQENETQWVSVLEKSEHQASVQSTDRIPPFASKHLESKL
jgi:hypothetical protein